MRRPSTHIVRNGIIALFLAAGLLGAEGCSDRGKSPKIKKKNGIARKIDLENRIVSMAIVDKQNNEIELPGTFRDDTVVVINGRTMSIKDIRPGDKVEVTGYREGSGETAKWIATRVEVTRPEESSLKSTRRAGTSEKPAPTTQPAG